LIGEKLNLPSQILAYNLKPDSILVTWTTSVNVGSNPIKRIQYYFDAVELKRNMDVILDSLRNYVAKPINVYGFNIKLDSFDDTLLVSTKKTFTTSPTVNEEYEMINNLHTYINSNHAAVTDSPMIHVQQLPDGKYKLMIAIAIDHVIPENENYSIIRMVHMDGKYITADVYGGPGALENAHNQIELFMKDHSLTSPAIPFEILKADRSKIKDTSKWVTKIYHPST
jgi:hypothetical protein